MSEASEIRRILVALDVSPGSLAAATAAAQLAALVDAELLGLFVEDVDLLRLSASALAREGDFLTSSLRGLEAGSLERQLKVLGGQARRELERIAGGAGIRWSFRVVRGAVVPEIMAAAAEADVVSLGRLGWSVRHKHRLGRIARELFAQRRRITLVSERRTPMAGPVVVLYDGSETSSEGLVLGLRLALLLAAPVHVLLLGEGRRELRREVLGRIDERLSDTWIESLGRATPERLKTAVCRRSGGVVIVPLGRSVLTEEHVRRLLEEVMCPILVLS